MPAPPKCPGCGTKLEPDMLACPNCPLSFEEKIIPSNQLSGGFLKDFVMPCLFLAVMAVAAYWVGQRVLALVRPAEKPAASVPPKSGLDGLDEAALLARLRNEDPEAAAKYIEGLSGVQPSADPELVAAVAKAAGPPPAPPAGREQEEAFSAVAVTKAYVPKPREWKFRGAVRDLVSLRALSGCKLTFTDQEEQKSASTVTGKDGRYRIILPPLEGRGYYVTIEREDYARAYLDPGADVERMEEERRLQTAKELATTVGRPAELAPFKDAPLETDFFLAPKR